MTASPRRVGLWMVGALGGVGSSVALGLAGQRLGLADSTGMVTALPEFSALKLDGPDQFVLGGHDIRKGSFRATLQDLHERSGVFSERLLAEAAPWLEEWSANVCPGTVLSAGETISRLADRPDLPSDRTPRLAIDRLKVDLQRFQTEQRLQQVVVVHVASTEPPAPLGELHESWPRLRSALESPSEPSIVPASSLYALAAIELGWPYVNFTPSLGASFPAALELAGQTGAVLAGQDGKTGETLLKSVLAPMFAARNLKVLSWVGHNIFGNRDGLVLSNPANKSAKIKTKDQIVAGIVGYKPQTHVSIEYIESLDDWKTAWDHIHFQGFLGVKMMLQFTWQGCDSLLAAPLVIDLARMALHAHRQGQSGLLPHLACFFKNPMGVEEMDFFKQQAMLLDYIRRSAPLDQGRESAQ